MNITELSLAHFFTGMHATCTATALRSGDPRDFHATAASRNPTVTTLQMMMWIKSLALAGLAVRI